MTSRLRALTPAQHAAFLADGHVFIPDVFSAAEMDEALRAADAITYGMPFAAWRERVELGETMPAIADGIGAHDPARRAQFPTGVDRLDRLIAHERLLDLLADAVGSDDLAYVNGHLFVRAGPTDRRHPAEPWQGFHFDSDTGTFLPPRDPPGEFDYVACSIVLHDIDDDCAPTAVVPGSHRQVAGLIERLHRDGAFVFPNAFPDIRRIPEFRPAVPATGTRGGVHLSSTYLVHAAVPFADRRRQRSLWTLSVTSGANARHTRYHNPFAYGEREFAMRFWAGTTPRVRALFGWPPPGHPYYTDETLRLLALRHPDMDLAPYRIAMPSPVARRATT